MDTIVSTTEPVVVDGCDKPVDCLRFPDAKMLVDKDTGALHVHNSEGTIASFSDHGWLSATRGVFNLDNDGAAVRRLTELQP